jgi:hypothetical protein
MPTRLRSRSATAAHRARKPARAHPCRGPDIRAASNEAIIRQETQRDRPLYVYDDFDYTLVAERLREFRDQVARRLSGELTEDGFKPLRLMNGAYLQLHANVLRIAILCGTLSSAQLHTLARIASKYDRKYSHFTTRQNWERPSKRSSSEGTPFGP